MASIAQLFRSFSGQPDYEECFVFGLADGELSFDDLMALAGIIHEAPGTRVHPRMRFGPRDRVGMVGPRPAFATAFSSNAVAVLQQCGFPQINRVEVFRRYRIPSDQDMEAFLAERHDRMTECVYPEMITTFASSIQPRPVQIIPVLQQGETALRAVNKEQGLDISETDIAYLHGLFAQMGRDPTDVELFQVAQMASDHSRHRRWGAEVWIDGQKMPHRLIDLVRAPYLANPGNSVLGFCDNASSIEMSVVDWFLALDPTRPSKYVVIKVYADGTCTVETHNHPTLFCPWAGAETGIGGSLRDKFAVGRGGLDLFALAGFSTMDLHIPGYRLPWESEVEQPVRGAAKALQIMLEAPAATWAYGNRHGTPNLLGITRTFELESHGQRWGYGKPIMLSGQVGQMNHQHAEKRPAKPGMKIVAIGGPAYRIGLGGGTASSQGAGELARDVAFNSVQRGDAMMALRTRNVIERCVELGSRNPIVSIHDQGAGGRCNNITELIEKIGGRIDIRQIHVGDTTLTVLEIWSAEYQECYGLLIRADDLAFFISICEREDCPYEVLGEVTGDGRVVVEDSSNNTTPVNLVIKDVMAGLPQWQIHDTTPPSLGSPLKLPPILTVQAALERVLRLPVVGSKGFLVHRVDRSVGGRVVAQQCCGPFQLPVGDYALSALGFSGSMGLATALGEQPLKTMLNPVAGVRMAIAEALLNLSGVVVSGIHDIKMQGNVMWPGSTDGNMARLYQALDSGVRTFLPQLGFVEDGGKDSMSMRAADVSGRTIFSPHTFVATLYAPVPNMAWRVTPDIKQPGDSVLLLVDPSRGCCRLGGSALAQVYNQLGDESPDIDNPELLAASFEAVQELIRQGMVLSCHDRSDGGLITTLLEMAFAGKSGLDILAGGGDLIPLLFAEEAGIVLEVDHYLSSEVVSFLQKRSVFCRLVGFTTDSSRISVFQDAGSPLFTLERSYLRQLWEQTSFELEKLQINPECAEAEYNNPHKECSVPCRLWPGFRPQGAVAKAKGLAPKVAILRTVGTNGQLEMASLFHQAGFEVVDVQMTDLFSGRLVSLNEFRGIVLPGGFANSDVFGAGRAWAIQIQRNPVLRRMFEEFLAREDVFSLGVCNGCQLMSVLGWAPWRTMDPDPSLQPRFLQNISKAFESRWSVVRVLESPAIMFRDMAGAQLGIHVAHGEGRLWLPNQEVELELEIRSLVPLAYVGPDDQQTEAYPYNPNGSPHGWTALCDPSGRHVAMMPHPERLVRLDAFPYLPPDIRKRVTESPWLQCVYNLYQWCTKTR